MSMNFSRLIVLIAFAAAACGDNPEANRNTATEPATPTVAPAAPAPETAQPVVDPTARVTSPVVNHLPTAIAADVIAPTPGNTIRDAFIYFDAPAGLAVVEDRGPRIIRARDEEALNGTFGAGVWTAVNSTPPIALYQHNPSGDSGADCPSLEAVRERIGNAEIVAERRVATEWNGDDPMYGNEIDLLLFRNGEQYGFYVRTRFDHGDDYTDFCGAFGTKEGAFSMTTLGSAEQARQMAGMLLSSRESFD